ncbi:prohibitin family protein [Chlorobium sp. N1]|uniref:prohibitin family protein n=1 Tax=Chlorobium sp. N1 TaxID=2491138 RepID=UPI00103D7F67|nr:prohibitin family protein [Chlorobium sp. N1]TCD48088.1 prohibitin family protein [Chlorobium sp. N1]
MSLFILLGLALFLLAMANPTNNPAVRRMAGVLRIAGVVVVLIGIFSSAVRIVEPGKVGVKNLFGKVQAATLKSGLNIINPLAKVELFDITTQSYTMSDSEQERSQLSDGPIRVLSADGLEVTIDMTALYRINPEQAPAIRREIGPGYTYIDKIVRPTARTRIRDNAVMYNAIDLYSKKRDEFQANIFESISKDFEKRGIILENLLVRNVSLPESVKLAIEAKINAEQEAQKMQFVLQKETQEAERKRVEAKGISDYQRTISESLNEKLLKYEEIKVLQNLVKTENSKVIILGESKNASMLIGDK